MDDGHKKGSSALLYMKKMQIKIMGFHFSSIQVVNMKRPDKIQCFPRYKENSIIF